MHTLKRPPMRVFPAACRRHFWVGSNVETISPVEWSTPTAVFCVLDGVAQLFVRVSRGPPRGRVRTRAAARARAPPGRCPCVASRFSSFTCRSAFLASPQLAHSRYWLIGERCATLCLGKVGLLHRGGRLRNEAGSASHRPGFSHFGRFFSFRESANWTGATSRAPARVSVGRPPLPRRCLKSRS